jgi:hypothetical protein
MVSTGEAEMNPYKRVIETKPGLFSELMSHQRFGVVIRRVPVALPNGNHQYMIETSDRLERRAVDKIVELFAV